MESPARKKELGQHHLREPALCRPLVDYLSPVGERVVEIGLGGGVLTAALLAAGARVVAWEIDPAWAFEGRRRFRRREEVLIVNGDALELPWARLPEASKVAGNLPYNVATALIDRLLDHGERIAAAAFLVQLEVAERLVARPGGKAYGATSVLTEARAEATLLGRVKPGSFVPPPKVDSGFIGLRPRSDAPSRQRVGRLRRLVYTAFGKRRKTLRNALADRWPRDRVAAAIESAGLPLDVRAERVSYEDFSVLLNQLDSV